jgi:hypothetical protein
MYDFSEDEDDEELIDGFYIGNNNNSTNNYQPVFTTDTLSLLIIFYLFNTVLKNFLCLEISDEMNNSITQTKSSKK